MMNFENNAYNGNVKFLLKKLQTRGFSASFCETRSEDN